MAPVNIKRPLTRQVRDIHTLPNCIQFAHRVETQSPDETLGEPPVIDSPLALPQTTDQPTAVLERTSSSPALAPPESSEESTNSPPTPSVAAHHRPSRCHQQINISLRRPILRRRHHSLLLRIMYWGHDRRQGTKFCQHLGPGQHLPLPVQVREPPCGL